MNHKRRSFDHTRHDGIFLVNFKTWYHVRISTHTCVYTCMHTLFVQTNVHTRKNIYVRIVREGNESWHWTLAMSPVDNGTENVTNKEPRAVASIVQWVPVVHSFSVVYACCSYTLFTLLSNTVSLNPRMHAQCRTESIEYPIK